MLAGVVITALLCAGFIRLLAAAGHVTTSGAPTLIEPFAGGHAWMASFMPCWLLLGVFGTGAVLGVLFRSERRVGAAVRVSTTRRTTAPRS